MTWTPPPAFQFLPTPIALLTAFLEPVDAAALGTPSTYDDLAVELVGRDNVHVLDDIMVFQRVLLTALSVHTTVSVADLLQNYGRAALAATPAE